MTETVSLADYVAILKRRRWYVAIPTIVVLLVSAAIAFLLPPVYRSSATILIESPDVPPQLVASTITGFAEQQIQVINQRVTSTQRLVEIINRYNLYPEARQQKPIFAIAEDMRKDISLNLISAQIGGRDRAATSGMPQATVAFTLSFDYVDPAVAQRVANELVSLYLSENARSRQEKASETTAFLAIEADRLERVIGELDKQLADLKQRYQGSLPEQLNFNLSIIARNEAEQRALDQRLQALVEREIYLEAELIKLDPYMTGGGAAAGGGGLGEQLRAYRARLVALAGRYGPDHPDVVKMRREVEALEKDQGSGISITALQMERDRLQSQLAVLQEKYAADHPDVMIAKRQLATVEGELQTASAQQAARDGNRSGDRSVNPAYIQLQAQLKATRAEMAGIARQREAVLQQISEVEKLVLQTPVVERDYQRIRRDYESAVADYSLIKEKRKAAQLGEALETERKGERFSLVEPPQVPSQPIKPKRFVILGLGAALAVAAGLGCAILAEAADSSIYGARQLVALTGVSPLVVIPYIRTQSEIRKARRERLIYGGTSAAVVVGAIVFVHFQVVPLDVLWTSVQRQVQSFPLLARLVAG